MATLLTHALVAGFAAPAAPPALSRSRVAAAAIALSVLPDADVVAFALGIPYEHPLGHRGVTHSLAFAAVAGAAAASWAFPVRTGSRDWWRLAAVLSLACASHGVLDALTSGGRGVGFFIPFTGARYFLPWRPLLVSPIGVADFLGGPVFAILRSEIVHVWLPCAALALGWRWRRARRDARTRAPG